MATLTQSYPPDIQSEKINHFLGRGLCSEKMAFVKANKYLFMKKLKLLLLLTIFGASANSQLQQIKIVSFTVKNQLPSAIDNWNSSPAALLLVAQKLPQSRPEGVRLVLQIKSGGAVICGNTSATGLPVDNFTTRTFTVGELTGGLTSCPLLKDGSYTICAQFYNIDKVAISNEVCKDFTVESPQVVCTLPPGGFPL